jgi:Flp pilus assembly protein TadG
MNMQSQPKSDSFRRPRRFGFFSGGRRRSQGGQAMVELAVSIPLLMIVIAGAIDFGTACYVAIEVTSAARSGAQYGAQNATTMQDINGMILAAKNGAQQIGSTCSRGKTCWNTSYPTAAFGCECADGTVITPNNVTCSNCSTGNHWINYVTVTTVATYYPMIPWPGISSSYTFNGYAKMRLGIQ